MAFLELGDLHLAAARVVDPAQQDGVSQARLARLGMDRENPFERGQRFEKLPPFALLPRQGDAGLLVGGTLGQRVEFFGSLGVCLSTGKGAGSEKGSDQPSTDR